ncbi:hypothetical protein KKG71_06285, partial [Patescibacteria group bacterium]|nr:hypothetical protein [Patescibacteria group bacterium]
MQTYSTISMLPLKRQKVKSEYDSFDFFCPNAPRSEGEAEGGCGGNSASPEPKRSPAALLVQSRGQQKSFLFLLE